MPRTRLPPERHSSRHMGWLRAAVLGANDGIVSTASLIVGVAAAHSSAHNILVTGASGLVAGAMSMAAGEYVSVSSQSDTERADLGLERRELSTHPGAEQAELAAIYVGRGLDPALAAQVATQLMAHDALGAHARDELGIAGTNAPHPRQAALASAASFSVGAALPLLMILVLPRHAVITGVSLASLAFLAVLGGLAAARGGASLWKGAARVTFWGALALAVTAGVGTLFKGGL